MFRLTAHPSAFVRATRHIHASPVAAKNMKKQVQDIAQDVNLKLGRGMAAAIDKGEELTEAAKVKLGAAGEATKKEASEVGQQKFNEAKSQTEKASKVGQQKMNQAATGVKEDFQQK